MFWFFGREGWVLGGRADDLVGKKNSLGVFLWATGSTMDYDLPFGPFLKMAEGNGTRSIGME